MAVAINTLILADVTVSQARAHPACPVPHPARPEPRCARAVASGGAPVGGDGCPGQAHTETVTPTALRTPPR